MVVKSVSVQNFRNIKNAAVNLNCGLNMLIGDNAQGKTNFLEAVYLCATGRSQRAVHDGELIAFESSTARVQCIVQDTTQDSIYVMLRKDAKKAMAVNGLTIKALSELFGILLAVIFSPEDLRLLKAGPVERRRFMDLEICQLSKVYYHELQQYYRVLRQRNALLKRMKNKKDPEDTLTIWDEQLANHGEKIMSMREGFIEHLNDIAPGIHRRITREREVLRIVYKPHVQKGSLLSRVQKSRERDLLQGSTSVGIHKDDILFLINDADGRVYGSQGQQRTAALSTKLAQIDLIRQQKDKKPVLLLDDVMSELDAHRQQYLLESVSDLQVLITCTGVEDIAGKHKDIKNIGIYHVKEGVIQNGIRVQ